MKDFIHDGSKVNRPNLTPLTFAKELAGESLKTGFSSRSLSTKDNKKAHQAYRGLKAFGIEVPAARGVLYTHNEAAVLFANQKLRSHHAYEVDFVTFKIVWTRR